MANLIVTVISIALVAVAALMGTYYGGSAFMDGQQKARANQVVRKMAQLATAFNLCAGQNADARDISNSHALRILVLPKHY